MFKDTVCDENHKVVSMSDTAELMRADSVIIAVSQKPSNLILTDTEGLELTPRGLAKTDENGMTSIPGLFASGTVVAIDAYLKKIIGDEIQS